MVEKEKKDLMEVGEDSEDLMDVEGASKILMQSVSLDDGETMVIELENIKRVEFERNGKHRVRYAFFGTVVKDGETYENARWFSGIRFYRDLITEAKRRGIKHLKGKRITVKRIGSGLSTVYAILDIS